MKKKQKTKTKNPKTLESNTMPYEEIKIFSESKHMGKYRDHYYFIIDL